MDGPSVRSSLHIPFAGQEFDCITKYHWKILAEKWLHDSKYMQFSRLGNLKLFDQLLHTYYCKYIDSAYLLLIELKFSYGVPTSNPVDRIVLSLFWLLNVKLLLNPWVWNWFAITSLYFSYLCFWHTYSAILI